MILREAIELWLQQHEKRVGEGEIKLISEGVTDIDGRLLHHFRFDLCCPAMGDHEKPRFSRATSAECIRLYLADGRMRPVPPPAVIVATNPPPLAAA